MGFDFAKAIKVSEARLKHTTVEAVLLGCSGSGKSAAAGSFGVKTLYLRTNGEKHGPVSAKTYGKSDIVDVNIERDDNGVDLTADAAYQRTLDILGDIDGIKSAGFKAVILDGATEFEAIIRKTGAFKKACLTNKGEHNTFLESTAVNNQFREVTNKLRALADEGIHYAVTCILDVKLVGDSGEIEEAAPRISTYSCAESLIQQFGDVLVVGKMVKGEEVDYRFQFGAVVNKTSKDAAGRVKKTLNYAPRLSGVVVDFTSMKAKLSDVIKLKEGKK